MKCWNSITFFKWFNVTPEKVIEGCRIEKSKLYKISLSPGQVFNDHQLKYDI